MTPRRGNRTPWIYRPTWQASPTTSRRIIIVWMIAVVLIAGTVTWMMLAGWGAMPLSALPGAILVILCGMYALVALVMLARNKNKFD